MEVATFGKIHGKFSRPLFHLPLLGFACVVSDAGDSLRRELELSNHRSSRLGGFDVPLAMALCKNLPAEITQRQLSRPKPARVAAPIEEEDLQQCYLCYSIDFYLLFYYIC